MSTSKHSSVASKESIDVLNIEESKSNDEEDQRLFGLFQSFAKHLLLYPSNRLSIWIWRNSSNNCSTRSPPTNRIKRVSSPSETCPMWFIPSALYPWVTHRHQRESLHFSLDPAWNESISSWSAHNSASVDSSGLSRLAMRSHPHSRPTDHEEIDTEHHLIHLTSFADVIIPKLVQREYRSASESDLLKYLKRLDQTNKNHLHKKLFIQTLSSMEDALDTNESEELAMFFTENDALAIENRPDFFDYKRYVKHLFPERHRIYLNLLTKESK